jgi:hypothetical protein
VTADETSLLCFATMGFGLNEEISLVLVSQSDINHWIYIIPHSALSPKKKELCSRRTNKHDALAQLITSRANVGQTSSAAAYLTELSAFR